MTTLPGAAEAVAAKPAIKVASSVRRGMKDAKVVMDSLLVVVQDMLAAFINKIIVNALIDNMMTLH